MPATPFTDPTLIAGALYANPARLAQRTTALRTAKISGEDATATIIELAGQSAPTHPVVCDIGCGRGTTTLRLAEHLKPGRLIALDQSQPLLDTVHKRLTQAGHIIETMRGDYHHLPLPEASVDIAVAAFCLYHSPHPEQVIAEIARCLQPGGKAVLATKSADSYHEIDRLLSDADLAPDASGGQSLYETFHSGNASGITDTALHVEHVVHQQHVFQFAGLEHLAAYVATSPKYRLPQHVVGDAAALGEEFRRRIPDRPVTATSTVTYVTAVRR